MEFSKRFYEILRSKCSAWGARRKLAEQAGITESALNKILQGTTKDPGLSTVSAIVDAVGIDMFAGLPETDRNTARRELAKAQSEIERLKTELALAEGRLDGMQRAYELALDK